MTPTKEDVKKWMKKAGLTRDWLAEKCFVKRSAVNSWLSTDRGIPAAKLALIEKLMEGNEDISLNLPDQFEAMLREKAEAAKKDINDYVLNILEDFVRDVLKATKLKQNRYEDEKISDIQKINPVEPLPAASFLDQPVPVIGNIAAGALTPGDNIPYHIKTERPVGKWEYVLQVEGKSMEPVIPDGSLVVMRKHTIPPIPKVGTIVEYNDERGVTLKKLGRKKNPETGKMEYVLHPLNPDFGDIEPMDGGKISGVYVETLEKWKKA